MASLTGSFLTYTLNTKRIRKAAAFFEREAREELWRCALASARRVEAQAKATAPKSAGTLQKKINTRRNKRILTVNVGTNAAHGPSVEMGTGRHYRGDKPQRSNAGFVERLPPIANLKAWAKQKGINPWALAKGLRKQGGTKAQPYLEPAWAREAPSFIRCSGIGVVEIAAKNTGRKFG